jgi:hypothetical protein
VDVNNMRKYPGCIQWFWSTLNRLNLRSKNSNMRKYQGDMEFSEGNEINRTVAFLKLAKTNVGAELVVYV